MAKQKEQAIMIDDTNKDFIQYCRSGNIKKVKELFYNPLIDISFDDGFAFQNAVYHGHVEIVKMFLADERFDPTLDNNFAICWAAESSKSVDTIKLLLEDGRVDPSENNNEPLYNAMAKHNYEVAKILLTDPRVDPFGRFGQLISVIECTPVFEVILKNKKHVNKLYIEYFNEYKNFPFYRIPTHVRKLLMKKMNLKLEAELEIALKII